MGALLNVDGARVLGRDQEGNPALVVHECGRGRTMLCAYPFELTLGATPNGFEGGSPYWRLYRALKEFAGIRSPFGVERPEVEVGWLTGVGRDYVILVNHAPGTVGGDVVTSRGEGVVTHILPEGSRPVECAGDSWPFELPGFTGTLFEWHESRDADSRG
jgi:hypothetical protein